MFMGSNIAYPLRQHYENLLNDLDETAVNANCGLVKSIGKFSIEADGSFVMDGYVHLMNWTARGSSRKEQIHILIHVQETIRRQGADYILEKSTVRVCYYEIDGNHAKLLHGVHFDHGPEQQAHPIFHAQFSGDEIALTSEAARELEFEYQQVCGLRCCKNARIPTSDMTLPSVLLCLAADHIKADFFPEFMKRVRELQMKMPQPNFSKIKESIQSEPNHFRSSHWFAHTT